MEIENINRIESEKRALLAERDECVTAMQKSQTQLMAIKNLIRSSGRMENHKYRQCCDSQTEHAKNVNKCTERMREIKDKLRQLESEKEYFTKQINGKNGATTSFDKVPIVRELVNLRAEYQQFSADFTRVSSMRSMAADFALRLDRIIKSACEVNAEERRG